MRLFIAERNYIFLSSVVGAQSLPGYNELANVTNINVRMPCLAQEWFRLNYLNYSSVRCILFLFYVEQYRTGRTVEIVIVFLTTR